MSKVAGVGADVRRRAWKCPATTAMRRWEDSMARKFTNLALFCETHTGLHTMQQEQQTPEVPTSASWVTCQHRMHSSTAILHTAMQGAAPQTRAQFAPDDARRQAHRAAVAVDQAVYRGVFVSHTIKQALNPKGCAEHTHRVRLAGALVLDQGGARWSLP
jgi:hypothetical protein